VSTKKATLNLELESKLFKFPNGTMKLDVWDTVFLKKITRNKKVGQERYQSLAQFYLKDASLAIIVFDVCQRASFNDVIRWVEMIGNDVSHEVIIFIAANKIDMYKEYFKYYKSHEKDV